MTPMMMAMMWLQQWRKHELLVQLHIACELQFLSLTTNHMLPTISFQVPVHMKYATGAFWLQFKESQT
jgi:hypothetical protein